ncbi:hypothetical protein D3C77_65980 [compost metagenome]
MQVFDQLLVVAAQAMNGRYLGIADGADRCIRLGDRQAPDRLVAVANGQVDCIIAAHRRLVLGLHQHALGDAAQKLQLALAVVHHRFNSQCLQMQVVLAVFQFTLVQLPVLAPGKHQGDDEGRQKTQDYRAPGTCAGQGQEQAGTRRGRWLGLHRVHPLLRKL